MPFLIRDNARVFYDVTGDLNTSDLVLTLINGHTRTSSDFRAMSRELSARNIATVTLDNRGSGQTETSEAFSLKDMAGDVAAVWQDLEVARSALLGISMGGAIALELALAAQDVVSHLILVSTALSQEEIRSTNIPWEKDLSAIERKLSLYFAKSFSERNRLLITSMAKNVLKAIERGTFMGGSTAQSQALRGATRDESSLKNLESKVLIIHGEEDQIIPVAAAQRAQRLIPGSNLILYPGVGHLILAENPAAFYQDVASFLKNS